MYQNRNGQRVWKQGKHCGSRTMPKSWNTICSHCPPTPPRLIFFAKAKGSRFLKRTPNWSSQEGNEFVGVVSAQRMDKGTIKTLQTGSQAPSLWKLREILPTHPHPPNSSCQQLPKPDWREGCISGLPCTRMQPHKLFFHEQDAVELCPCLPT